MVLTTKVGKERSFWVGLLLTIATWGIYGIYWHYKAHIEVHKQYELDKEGKDDGLVWLVLGLVVSPLIFVYYWKFVENVAYVRERMRLPRSMTPGKFLGLQALAIVAFIVALIVGFVLVAVSLPEGADGSEELTPEQEAALEENAAGIALAFGGGFLVLVAILAYAYWRLQTDINETWRWYDAHMGQLTGAPPGPPPYVPPAPAAPPGLPPAPPEPPAPPRDPTWP